MCTMSCYELFGWFFIYLEKALRVGEHSKWRVGTLLCLCEALPTGTKAVSFTFRGLNYLRKNDRAQ